jgi:hypothetical protein
MDDFCYQDENSLSWKDLQKVTKDIEILGDQNQFKD